MGTSKVQAINIWARWILAKYEVDTFPEVQGEEDAAARFPLNEAYNFNFDKKQSRNEIEVRLMSTPVNSYYVGKFHHIIGIKNLYVCVNYNWKHWDKYNLLIVLFILIMAFMIIAAVEPEEIS